MARNSGALVVGYRKEDQRRFSRIVGGRSFRVGGMVVPVLGASRTLTLEGPYRCDIVGGKCISCGRDVYLNQLGYSAVLEKDADVVCMECEDRYSADITRAL